MTTQHTPGPWHVYTGRLRKQFPTPIIEVQDAKGRSIVPWPGFDSCDLPKKERFANARLIAAAPVLLAALKLVSRNLFNDLGYDPNRRQSISFTDEQVSAIKAAIAAAEKGA